MKTPHKGTKMERVGDNEVVFTRYFKAPRQLVFDCHTRPELMRRWLVGPDGAVLETCENDVRPGGKYLYIYADRAGNRGGVYGHFREVSFPEKLSNTENYIMDLSEFDPNAEEDPNATFESRTFTSEGDLTLMTHHCVYASGEILEMVLGSGADQGMDACYELLNKLLSEMP